MPLPCPTPPAGPLVWAGGGQWWAGVAVVAQLLWAQVLLRSPPSPVSCQEFVPSRPRLTSHLYLSLLQTRAASGRCWPAGTALPPWAFAGCFILPGPAPSRGPPSPSPFWSAAPPVPPRPGIPLHGVPSGTGIPGWSRDGPSPSSRRSISPCCAHSSARQSLPWVQPGSAPSGTRRSWIGGSGGESCRGQQATPLSKMSAVFSLASPAGFEPEPGETSGSAC